MKVRTSPPLLHPRKEHRDQAAVLAVFAFLLGLLVGENL